jgi:hypothetical protein
MEAVTSVNFYKTVKNEKKNTYTGIRQQELAKGARQQKEENTYIYILILIYTISTNLILISIPILRSPEPKTLIF